MDTSTPYSFLDIKGFSYLSCTIHASDDAHAAQLSQEHNGMEFPIAFLSHTFMDTQRKWEYHQTGTLQSILCSHKVDLLPQGS